VPKGASGDSFSGMATKRDRHALILELIDGRPVGTQEELRRLLKQRGLDVTQSTLSRDVHELRLARVPTSEGVRYTRAEGTTAEGRATLEALGPHLVTSLDGVSEFLVVRTPPGSAQTVARAIDSTEGGVRSTV